MSEVTEILDAIEQGDAQAADALLPLVYKELRRLAAYKLGQEAPGQTLDATALVHEAYLKLVGTHAVRRWQDRGRFFAAAAEAMRRILVDKARRKRSDKRGGKLVRRHVELLTLQVTLLAHRVAQGRLESGRVHDRPCRGRARRLLAHMQFAGAVATLAADGVTAEGRRRVPIRRPGDRDHLVGMAEQALGLHGPLEVERHGGQPTWPPRVRSRGIAAHGFGTSPPPGWPGGHGISGAATIEDTSNNPK